MLRRSPLMRLRSSRISLFRATSMTFGPVGPDAGKNFKIFSEIDGATDQRIESIRHLFATQKAGVEDDWIAGEKIHGANFGLYVIDNGERVRWGKRTGFIPEGDFFYGYHAITPTLEQHARTGYKLMCEKLNVNSLDTFLINGEIFGGKYLHPRVPRSKQTTEVQGQTKMVSPVQKDDFPQYTPDLNFYAYDIKYRVDKESDFVMMDHDDCIAILTQIPGLLYERPILRGKLEQILALDLESFQTTLPGILGLGDFYLKNNKAEGIVIRHAKRGTIEGEKLKQEKRQTGSPGPGIASGMSAVTIPTIIKVKCQEFEEMYNRANIDSPMHAVRARCIEKFGSQLPSFTAVFPTPKEQANCQTLMDHNVSTRLNNVVSKIGDDPFINHEMTKEKLAFMLAEDAIKDYIKDLGRMDDANLPLILRREMCRYCLFAAKRLVEKEWNNITSSVIDAQNTTPAPSEA